MDAHVLCSGGCGYGDELETPRTFREEADLIAKMLLTGGMRLCRAAIRSAQTRVQFQHKDTPRVCEFKKHVGLSTPRLVRPIRSWAYRKERP